MAAKVGILKSHQQLSEQPPTFVKKAVAALLVRRLLAEEIHRGLIRMLHVAPIHQLPASKFAPARKPYIPSILPPAEVQGVTFDDPVNRAPGSLVFTRLWAERQEQHA